MQTSKTLVIEITKHIKVTGRIDDVLVNHLKNITQEDFYEWQSAGITTPCAYNAPDHYEDTELLLLRVTHTIKPVYNG